MTSEGAGTLGEVRPRSDGGRQLITTGYREDSHRELDDRTTEGHPDHPHTWAVPVGCPVTHKTYEGATDPG